MYIIIIYIYIYKNSYLNANFQAPLRGGWILWKQILAPWFFAEPQEQPEMSEKKQRKLEKKMARRH